MNRRAFPLLLAACLGGAGPALAHDWPGFRRPGVLGLSQARGLPVTWAANQNVQWQTELPGPGGSSPIVVGEKIFVTCYSGYGLDRKQPGEMKDLKRHLVCLHRNGGRILWKREVPAEQPEARYGAFLELHGYASSTPASDGRAVFVFF